MLCYFFPLSHLSFLSVFSQTSCNLLFHCSMVHSNKTVISRLQSNTQLCARSYDLKYLIKQHVCFSDLCWHCSRSRSCIFCSHSEALLSAFDSLSKTTKSQKKQPHCFVIAQEHLLNDFNLHVDKCFRLLFKIPYLPLFP